VRRSLLAIAVLAVLLAALPAAAAEARRGACVAGVRGLGCEVWTAKVRSVNDGDTIDVDVIGDGTTASRRIRFAGVQALEQTVYAQGGRQGACHAVEATERVERLIKRSRWRVRLAAEDPLSTAQRRSVRTVAVRSGKHGPWRDVGATLMREGLALWWPLWSESSPNLTYSTLLQRAILAQRGMFDPDGCGVGPSAASPLKLNVNWDADGSDTANASDEWVEIRNLDPVNPVPLAGWYLRDAGLRDFLFASHAVIPPGGRITVDVGTQGDDVTVFPWGQRQPVFTNATYDDDAMGDGAYLFDPLGNVRAAMTFPCRWQCVEPLQNAIGVSADWRGRGESIVLSNPNAGPVDLDDYVVKSAPRSYHLPPGTILAGGASMRIRIVADDEPDTPLDRDWGLAAPMLRDAGDVVELRTYTDIRIGCFAWGDRSC